LETKRRIDGAKTRLIGEKLVKNLSQSDYLVFFDHGDSASENVCQPTSYMGRRYGSDATLSGIDIAIVHGGKVIVLAEVEESAVRPKTVLGDIFGAVVADRIRIKGKSYSLEEATLVVSLVTEEKGKRGTKYSRLERQVAKYLSDRASSSGKPRVGKVRIVPCSDQDIVRRTERLVRLEAHKAVKAK
jgi:hypothetical protein